MNTNRRFLNYKKYDNFQRDLNDGKISEDSIVFIQDPNKRCIWARGVEYAGSLSSEEFNQFKTIYLAFVQATTNAINGIDGRVTSLENIIEENHDGVINKFNEIVDFLNQIPNSNGDPNLKQLLADIASTIPNVSNKADKSEIPTVPTNVSAFTNDSGYLVAADIAGKADKADTYTKTEVDEKIDDIIGGDINLQNYYTKAEVDVSQAAQDTVIAAKAPQATTYTKTEVDNLLSPKANLADLATVATSGDYDDLINKPTIPAAQVQSDWDETGTGEPSFIKNKPTNVSAFTNDARYIAKDDLNEIISSELYNNLENITQGKFVTVQQLNNAINIVNKNINVLQELIDCQYVLKRDVYEPENSEGWSTSQKIDFTSDSAVYFVITNILFAIGTSVSEPVDNNFIIVDNSYVIKQNNEDNKYTLYLKQS